MPKHKVISPDDLIETDYWDKDFRVPTIKIKEGKRHLRLGKDGSFCGRYYAKIFEHNVTRATNNAKFVTCGLCFNILCDLRERVGEDWLLLILVGIHRFGHDPQLLPLAEEYRNTGDITPLLIAADYWDEGGDIRGEIIRCTYEIVEHREDLTLKRYCELINARESAGKKWISQAEFGNLTWVEARNQAKKGGQQSA